MSEKTPACLVCGQTDQQIPLIQLRVRGEALWICPQHLPVLIHKPQQLVGLLPGAELLSQADHED